jgi:paraquat-inducible protein A
VQQVEPVPRGFVAKCARCKFELFHRRPNSRVRTLAFTLAALMLYIPSNLYPVVTAEYHGLHTETTVMQGINALYRHQQYFIGTLVLCTSVITPAMKIVGLLAITLTLGWEKFRRLRARIYKIIHFIDPWNMLEVFLLAISVSLIELGRVATVRPGPGVFSFAAVVVLTLLATLSFDPRLLWDANASTVKARHD